MKKTKLILILVAIGFFSLVEASSASTASFLGEFSIDSQHQYLNIEDNTFSSNANRNNDSELELLGGELHTTCNANPLAISEKQFFSDVTLNDCESANYDQMSVVPEVGLIFYQKANLGSNYCDGPFEGYAKFEILSVHQDTSGTPIKINFKYEYTSSGFLNELTSPLIDDTMFVKQVYQDFLNRAPDAEGLAYWTGEISSGNLTRTQMVEQYLVSAEFGETISPVVRLYFTYYQRIPDYEGLMFWVNSYAAGMSLNDISDAFATAQEFIDKYGSLANEEFVSQMYVNVYGRQPDAEGLAYWTDILDAATLTRGQVMVEFSSAEEYLSISANQVYVTMTYMGLLRRAPEQEGFDYWTGVMDGGTSGLGLIDSFLLSDEYIDRFSAGSINIEPNFNLEPLSSYHYQKSDIYVDAYDLVNTDNLFFVHGYADFNQDGFTDVILAGGIFQEEVFSPVSLYLNDGSNNFSEDTTYIPDGFEGMQHPRKVIVGDYNNDSRMDAYIVGHGYDAEPYPGESPVLLLSTGNSFEVNILSDHFSFFHGASSADIDNDGDIDIFTIDGFGDSFFLINDGTGSFESTNERIDNFFHNKGGYYTTELIDVDSDGYVDLLVGGHEFEGATTYVLWGNNTGKYTLDLSTPIPTVPDFAIVVDFDAEDIDNDGDRDLVLNRVAGGGQYGFYDGYYVQVLENTGNRQFADMTSSRITNGSAVRSEGQWPVGQWFLWITMNDIDNDGDLDITTQDDYVSYHIWVNDGVGNFSLFDGISLGVDDDSDGYTENEGDCNDNDSSINPNGLEVCGDGIDQDCSGSDLVCAQDGSYPQPELLQPGEAQVEWNVWSLDWASSINGYRQVADIDMDGDEDIILTGATYPYEPFVAAREGLILLNDGNFSFSVARGDRPSSVHAREILIEDFDGNGLQDLYIADHGWDAPPFPGWSNQLLLQTEDGFIDISNSLPDDPDGFTHNAAAGDVDHDGDIDILVQNTGGSSTLGSYLLLNDGLANFSRNTSRLPASLGQPEIWSSWASDLADLDDDGFMDLILGASIDTENRSHIYWGNEDGYYRDEEMTVLPVPESVEIIGNISVISTQISDIDGNGLKDILLGSYNDDYTGRGLQILINNGNRQFSDQTFQRLGNSAYSTNEGWQVGVRIFDFNGDDHLDIVPEGYEVGESNVVAWLNDSTGHYVPLRSNDLANQEAVMRFGYGNYLFSGAQFKAFEFFTYEGQLISNAALISKEATVRLAE